MSKQKYRYQFTQDAAEDLKNIFEYSSQHWGQQQAQRYLQQLKKQCDLLCITPSIGIQSLDIDSSSFRFPYAEHMLYYKVKDSHVIIYAILHKSMLPEKHLSER